MIYTISNDTLCVKISDKGAEIVSVVNLLDGCEYMWQGDAKYWDGQAPVLFPICGRFYDGYYTYRGKRYEMGIHGFAAEELYEVTSEGESALTFTLRDNEHTRAMYPFAFTFAVTYALEGNTLHAKVLIQNEGEELLPATFGAHPGFNVPFTKGCSFESFSLLFGERGTPNKMIITPDGFYAGRDEALLLEDGNTLHLDHELFVSDGIFMNRMGDSVTLQSCEDPHAVTVKFSGFPYLGIWQEYGKDTPFICIEPWCGLPSYQGVHDDLDKKNDMFRLAAGERKTLGYDMIFS